ncbi:ATP-binding protein [Streptomyces sp. NPDC058469]|uniref:ATP-binding protein n=1 Tax=Streptomyces sp. NPDC058469 TaxID=3346514 RepID=UPI00364E4773
MNQPPPPSSRLELICEESSVRWARVHTRDVLSKWSVPDSVLQDVVLVVSELSTNAVKHTRRPATLPQMPAPAPLKFVLTLWFMPEYVMVYVYDQDRTPPAIRRANPDADGGRGLALVEQLTSEWGYIYPTPYSGKAVYAKVLMPGNPLPTDLPAAEVPLPRGRNLYIVREGLSYA